MQSHCPWAVERQAAEQDDARNGIGRVREAGTRKVVMNEPLREEATEQSLDDTVLQVQLNYVVINPFRRIENDGADGRFRPPLEIARAFLRRGPERVEGNGPSWGSAVANIEVGENKAGGRLCRGGRLF